MSGPLLRLFTASGAEVLVPLAAGTATDFAALLALADAESARAREAGFRVSGATGAKALDAGEEQEDIGWVVRKTRQGRNGLAHEIHLYAARSDYTKKWLVTYLNTPDEVRAFEQVSGLKVADLTEYLGEGYLERGKNPRTDELIYPVRRPFAAVRKPNPKYSEEEAIAAKSKPGGSYMVAKKKLVRWAEASSGTPAPAPAAPPPAGKPSQPPTAMQKAQEFVDRVQQKAQEFVDRVQQTKAGKPAAADPPVAPVVDFFGFLDLIATAESIPSLAAIWNDVNAEYRAGRLSKAEYEELTRTKDARKAVLGGAKK